MRSCCIAARTVILKTLNNRQHPLSFGWFRPFHVKRDTPCPLRRPVRRGDILHEAAEEADRST